LTQGMSAVVFFFLTERKIVGKSAESQMCRNT
jgi:hypothetical protein